MDRLCGGESAGGVLPDAGTITVTNGGEVWIVMEI